MILKQKWVKLKYQILVVTGNFKIKIFLRGHNGLKSIVDNLKSNDFQKIKIGIGRPNSKDPEVVANYVLGNFSDCKYI